MSTTAPAHVVLVEDERSLALLYQEYLKEENVRVTHVSSGREAIAMLDKDMPDAMLLDIRLPDMMGTDILAEINNRGLSIATIMITAHGSINTAVETMRSGAYDFLVKPFNRERLVQTLTSALNRHKLAVKVQKREVKFHTDFQGFIGSSQPMQVTYRMIEASANSRATCFITGESGTGKEVAAEAIHKLSPRKNKPFVVLNCAAIPKDLMESEIFGHIKGAFTGAISDQEGAASRANGGTLFLDEICEMDMHLQSKLLRFIQTETFNKVGSGKTEKVDIRFICATNRDPLVEIGAGRFREDLYYRLHVVPVPLPALRDRGEDIIAIAENFLATHSAEEGKTFTSFSSEARERLLSYSWPGNVRQLQNVIRNTVVLNQGDVVELSMLPPPLNTASLTASSLASMGHHAAAEVGYANPHANHGFSPSNGPSPQNLPVYAQPADLMGQARPQVAAFGPQANPQTGNSVGNMGGGFAGPNAFGQSGDLSDGGAYDAGPSGRGEIQPLWETEKRAILDAIDLCRGNIPKAAAMLGISASTIYRKKQSWEEEMKKAAAKAEAEAREKMDAAIKETIN